jgi:hypothetical protein
MPFSRSIIRDQIIYYANDWLNHQADYTLVYNDHNTQFGCHRNTGEKGQTCMITALNTDIPINILKQFCDNFESHIPKIDERIQTEVIGEIDGFKIVHHT